jgi:hypothetical protein
MGKSHHAEIAGGRYWLRNHRDDVNILNSGGGNNGNNFI